MNDGFSQKHVFLQLDISMSKEKRSLTNEYSNGVVFLLQCPDYVHFGRRRLQDVVKSESRRQVAHADAQLDSVVGDQGQGWQQRKADQLCELNK